MRLELALRSWRRDVNSHQRDDQYSNSRIFRESRDSKAERQLFAYSRGSFLPPAYVI